MAGGANISPMAKKPGKPSVSDAEAARIIAAMRGVLASPEYGGNKTKLSRALKISQPAVTQLLDGTNKPSHETAKSLGSLIGVDWRQWMDGEGEVRAPESEVRQPLHSRGHWPDELDPALEILIREGYSANESRRAVEAVAVFRSNTDIKTDDIVKLARALLREERQESGKQRRRGKHS
jgi:transcriptional regulator with XRE-family HTH domain